MGLYCEFYNSLFQPQLGITWELFPFPNLKCSFGNCIVPKVISNLDPS